MTSLLATLSALLLCRSILHAGATEPEPSTLPEGYVAYPDIGLAYKIHDAYVKWTNASDRCVAEGAQLAVIDSEKKLEYALRPPISGTYGIRHVGIRRVNRVWVSVGDGRALTTIPWAKDEPYSAYDRNCAMVAWKPKARRIMTGKCDFYGDFVCEIPVPAAEEKPSSD